MGGVVLDGLAPIGISVYKRIGHLRATVEALRNNTLAHKSSLYIFSDAPSPGDETDVMVVREFARSIEGFGEVNVIERKTNSRVLNNRGGLKSLLDSYGRAIFLEEDVVTAPGFLQFMNDSLDFYRDNPRVLTISGYCPPLTIPEDLGSDTFALRRFAAWGFATWRDRLNPFDLGIEKGSVKKMLLKPWETARFIEYGEDMLGMVLHEAKGSLDALDVKVMYHQFRTDTCTMYPRKSLVQNKGYDGSGLHCGVSSKFDVDLWDKRKDFDLSAEPQVNEVIKRSNYDFRRLGAQKRRQLFFRSLRFLVQA